MVYKFSKEIEDNFVFTNYSFNEVKNFVDNVFKDHGYHNDYLNSLSFGVYLSINNKTNKELFLKRFMMNLLRNDCIGYRHFFYDYPEKATHKFYY